MLLPQHHLWKPVPIFFYCRLWPDIRRSVPKLYMGPFRGEELIRKKVKMFVPTFFARPFWLHKRSTCVVTVSSGALGTCSRVLLVTVHVFCACVCFSHILCFCVCMCVCVFECIRVFRRPLIETAILLKRRVCGHVCRCMCV